MRCGNAITPNLDAFARRPISAMPLPARRSLFEPADDGKYTTATAVITNCDSTFIRCLVVHTRATTARIANGIYATAGGPL